jgi:hypothetical protein
MTTDTIQKNSKTGRPKISSRGGARAGAGRPKGSRERVTVQSLLETLDQKTGGLSYEDLLIEDFLQARLGNDNQLTLKYHTLIANKLISSLATVEVTDSQDAITAKQIAFAQAIAQITGLNHTN